MINVHAPRVIIYALINPFTSDVFYIGSTKKLLGKRLHEHVLEGKYNTGCNGAKNKIIKSILDQRELPLIEILEECYNYSDPYYAENFWIYQYRIVFKHPITNGLPHSKYHKARSKLLV